MPKLQCLRTPVEQAGLPHWNLAPGDRLLALQSRRDNLGAGVLSTGSFSVRRTWRDFACRMSHVADRDTSNPRLPAVRIPGGTGPADPVFSSNEHVRSHVGSVLN